MSLATLQRAFQAHLLDEPSALADAVTPGGRRGIPVYHHAYRATLRAALRDTFGRTALWLGDDLFDEEADRFITSVRSHSWTLADYGEAFPAALAATYAEDPEVGELAWLERSLRHAFGAAAVRTIGGDDFSSVDWETVRFDLVPSLACARVRSDLAGIWSALLEERAPDHVLLASEGGVVVWRDGSTPRFRMTDTTEVDALTRLRRHRSFSALCGHLGEAGLDVDAIGAMLRRWIADELLIFD